MRSPGFMSRDRILVVDANPLEGASLRAALFERGFDAVEASTADEALSLVPTFGPGAVLADTATARRANSSLSANA